MTKWSDCEDDGTCGLTVTLRGGQQKSTPDRFHDQHDTGRLDILDILGVQNVWPYLPVGAVELCTIQPHTWLYYEIRLYCICSAYLCTVFPSIEQIS